jgi:hypothetical protein
VPGIGIRHEQRIGADVGPVAAEHADLAFGKIERLCLRALKEAHAALLQRARQSDEKLARTKAAAEAIDDAADVKSLRRAVPPLDLGGGKDSKKRARRLSVMGMSARKLLLSMN